MQILRHADAGGDAHRVHYPPTLQEGCCTEAYRTRVLRGIERAVRACFEQRSEMTRSSTFGCQIGKSLRLLWLKEMEPAPPPTRVFKPTAEEFQNLLKYVASIRAEGERWSLFP